MKRKKLIVFVLSFSLVLFFGMLGNVIIMNTKEKSSEVNTTEFTATIKSIEIDGEGTNEYCIIFSEEYGNKLSTYNIRKISEISDFNRLESGQTVFFRVENIWLNQFEEMTFIPIVSIRTGEKEIVSLNNYNEYMDDLRLAPTIAGIAVALIIYCVLLLKVRMLLPM